MAVRFTFSLCMCSCLPLAWDVISLPHLAGLIVRVSRRMWIVVGLASAEADNDALLKHGFC